MKKIDFRQVQVWGVAALATLGSANVLAESPPRPNLNALEYSAFTKDSKLYVTEIAGDACNKFSVIFEVADNCKQSRRTFNLAPVCRATISLHPTELACNDQTPTPRVVTIDLDKADVDQSSKVLVLRRDKDKTNLTINR